MLENFRNMKSNAMQHLIPPSPFRDEGKVVYTITVTTGSMKYAGTDSNVSISITGASGDKTSLTKLDRSFRDDFERGSVDRFKVKLEDIGQPVILTIKYDESGMFADWFVVSVTIQKAGDSVTYRFPINMWITGTTDVAIGTAKLPQHEENPVLISHRKNELARKRREIRWRSQELEEAKGLPGYIAGECMEDLPRNFRLDEGMLKEFDEAKKNTKNFLFDKFQGVIEKCDNLTEIRNVFVHPKLPKIPDFHQNWERDEEFGRQLMNGCDPTIIKRCDSIPKKFPVTNSMVGSLLTRGITLEEEIKDGNIYLVDLAILEEIPCGRNPLNNSVFFSCAPMCLLYANCKNKLVPLAIQLWQQPGLNNPIWTPNDTDCDWMIAKMFFRNAESNIHMLSEKLLLTHMILEPFAVGIRRCLSDNHPVLKLLLPHLRYICGGNLYIRKHLISTGGALDRLMSYGGGSQQHVLQASFRNFNFDNLNLRKQLSSNGTDDKSKLPGYHFRDDAIMLWDCVRRFVDKIIKIFYEGNEDVQCDEELQKCIKEIRNEGFAWQDGKDKGVPNSFLTIDELNDFVASLIFTATCRYAALTNGIFDICINVPNSPFSASLPPPTQKGKTNQDTIMQTMPSKPLSCLQASVVHSFSKQPEAEAFLSDYPTTLFTEDSAQRAVINFRDELQKLSSVMRSRNEGCKFPYEYMLPEKIPIAASV